MGLFLGVLLALGCTQDEPSPNPERCWRYGIRGAAKVVPGTSYTGTDTYYIDMVEPHASEDVQTCQVPVVGMEDGVRKDCKDCVFAFELEIDATSPPGGCRSDIYGARTGYGVVATTPPTLMVLLNEDWLALEDASAAYDGWRFWFDHALELDDCAVVE